MSAARLTARDGARRIASLYFGIALPGPALLAALLLALLQLPQGGWLWLLAFGSAYAVIAVAGALRLRARSRERLALDRERVGALPDAQRNAAFAAVLGMPRALAAAALYGWLAAGALTALSMALRFRWFGVGEGAAVVGATAVAGAAAAGAMFFAVKRELEAARSALASEIASPEQRGALVKPISLRAKLVGCAVATSALPLLIAFA
ncbi:MAG TPA: hypothetical protein VEC18_02335, partial [Myxococcota bacterium]|nr:hypothetical protein [Myxococcota bacterium]